MNNSLGFAVERTNSFKKVLEDNFDLPIILIDERLSTLEAENILISTDTKRIKRKEVIDAYAAAIILDTYLKESRE
jgi:putative Holliday junction resolvase